MRSRKSVFKALPYRFFALLLQPSLRTRQADKNIFALGYRKRDLAASKTPLEGHAALHKQPGLRPALVVGQRQPGWIGAVVVLVKLESV
jgi:hypothetical protein